VLCSALLERKATLPALTNFEEMLYVPKNLPTTLMEEQDKWCDLPKRMVSLSSLSGDSLQVNST